MSLHTKNMLPRTTKITVVTTNAAVGTVGSTTATRREPESLQEERGRPRNDCSQLAVEEAESSLSESKSSDSLPFEEVTESTSSLSLVEALSYNTIALSGHTMAEMGRTFTTTEGLEAIIQSALAILDDSYGSLWNDEQRRDRWKPNIQENRWRNKCFNSNTGFPSSQ